MNIHKEALHAAISGIQNATLAKVGNISDAELAVAALTAALPFLTGVKELEWAEPSKETNGCWIAKCEIGTYSVVNENGWYAVLDEHAWGTKGFEWASKDLNKDTRQTAFDAAQADYEARIRSAIEVAPSPRAQALEEAARIAEAYIGGEHEAQGRAAEEIASELRALSSQPVEDGWFPIETAPKDKTIIGFGRMVGVNLCYHNGKQWNKTELSASFQLSAQAITHWRPLPASPGASE